MPAPIKAGTAERYWREVEGLSRLTIAFLRDPDLTSEERQRLTQSAETLKGQLVEALNSRAPEANVG